MSIRSLPPLLLMLTSLTTLSARLLVGQRAVPPATPQQSSRAVRGELKMALLAPRIGEIRLDGRLDDVAWASAPRILGFSQSYPNPGHAAVDSTEARVVYDHDAFYVGVRLFDAHPDSIAAQLSRRDATGIYSDWITLYFDSYDDRRTAFEFGVNPMGVKRDGYIANDGDEDLNWDAVWDVATRVDSLGWTAEFRIPLSQLRFTSRQNERQPVVGFQIIRDVARRNERDSWTPWTPDAAGFVSRFGELSGFVGWPSPRGLELLPYASSRVTRAPGNAANPLFAATATKESAGLDLRYHMAAGLTFTATVNPDFGQVEVDPSVVNLSAFETFFPEKRPFFLEGVDALTYGRVITDNDVATPKFFYSRRIGRPPQRSGGGAGVAFVDQPDQTTIGTAAKLTGKTGPWTVGFLDAVTPEQRARIVSVEGRHGTTAVEPMTNYFVGRVKRSFRDEQSFIGAFVTSTNRDLADTVFTPLLHDRATFGGVDFEHDIHRRDLILTGYAGESNVTGSPAAIAATQSSSAHYFQRPDAAYLHFDPARSSLTGHIAEIALKKNGSVYGSLGYKEESPGLELNDLGFQGRADFRALTSLIGFQNFTAARYTRSYNAYAYTDNMWDYGGNSVFVRLTAGAGATLSDLASVAVELTHYPRAMNNQLTRGGPLAEQPSSWSGLLKGATDPRKSLGLSTSGTLTIDETGGRSAIVNLSADYRPTSFIHLSAGPSLTGLLGTGQYVEAVPDANATATFGKRYVFASLHQTTLSLDTRADWTFTPAVSLQLYMQPFLSAGRYTQFKEFLVPRTYRFAVYGVDRGTITRSGSVTMIDPDGPGASPAFQVAQPDFTIRNLRGNAVLRWEYRPGSTLFLVWQQQRTNPEAVGDFGAGRDIGAIFRSVPTNVFLLKATYWISR